MRRPAGMVLAAAWITAAILPAPAAQPRGPEPPRVVAVGDVHGSLSGLAAILKAVGLIDDTRHWTGGATTFVQTGDLTDRGADVRGVLDLMMTLEREAPGSRGRVEALLGNHEVMNLLGDLRDATPAICASFAGPDADEVRARGWEEYERLVTARARSRPGESPPAYTRTKETWLEAYPPGCIEYREAFGPRGSYGRWLRSRPIATEVAGSVFMHAGQNPTGTATLSELNTTARREIERFDRFLRRLVDARLARPWFRFEDILSVAAAEVRWTTTLLADAKARGEAPDLQGIDVELVREASEILQIARWSLLAGDGPLWYRGYATAPDDALRDHVGGLLARWKARRLVVGHTVNRDYRVRVRLGTVFLIDTGMLAPVYKGVPSAIEVVGERVTAVYADGTRTTLVAPLAP